MESYLPRKCLTLRSIGLWLLLLSVVLQSGCAVFTDKKYRRCYVYTSDHVKCFKTLDDSVKIKPVWGRVAAFPVFMPAGAGSLVIDGLARFCAITTDMLIVNPVQIAPDSAKETADVVWDAGPDDLFYQSILFVPKLVVTPLFFTFHWTITNCFGD